MAIMRALGLSFTGLILFGASAAGADTESDRMKRLEDQVKMLLVSQQRLKDQQAENDKLIALLLTELQAAKGGKVIQPPRPNGPDSAAPRGLTFSGDVTARLDLTNLSSLQTGLFPEGTQGVLRERMRLNLAAPLGGRSEIGAQVSTGQTATPTLAFTANGDAFRGKSFSLADAYINYYFGPKDPNTARITFGKFPQTFWKAGVGGPTAFATEAAWDNDVMPEGANLFIPITRKGSKIAVSNNLGYYGINYPQKQRFIGLTTDIYGIADQLYLNANTIRAAFSYTVYDNLNSGLFTPTFLPGQGIDPSTATNAFLLRPPLQATNAHYSYGPAVGFGSNTFNLINFIGQIIPPAKPNAWQPFFVYEYLHNGSVNVLNDGYGISIGATKGNPLKRGAMTAWFTWRDIDADATLATFADSDLGGGTDYRGYQLGFTWRAHENLQFRLAYHDFDGAPNKTNSTQRFFFDIARYF